MKIPIDKVVRNPQQSRMLFDEAELQGLAQSIRENGLIQPIVVERQDGHYVLVDGERRLRAVKLLKQQTIEAVVREATNSKGARRRAASLVANIQRADLGPIEQAKAYRALQEELGTVMAVARKTGVTDSIIRTRLMLLEFPEPVRELFESRKLPIQLDCITAARKLPAPEQTRILTMAAVRGWTGKATRMVIDKALKTAKQPVRKVRRRDSEAKPAGDHFDALALVVKWQQLPPTMIQQARETCKACDLYEQASELNCRQCPLPDFLARCRLAMTVEGETK